MSKKGRIFGLGSEAGKYKPSSSGSYDGISNSEYEQMKNLISNLSEENKTLKEQLQSHSELIRASQEESRLVREQAEQFMETFSLGLASQPLHPPQPPPTHDQDAPQSKDNESDDDHDIKRLDWKESERLVASLALPSIYQMAPLLLFVSLFVVLLMKFFIDKSRKRRSNLPPGPPIIPIIGNLHQIGTPPHLVLQRLAQKYGPIIFLQLGQIPTVVVSSARLAKEVLKTHDLALCSRPQLFSAKYLLYNCTDIGFCPYGAYWRHVRKICILELLRSYPGTTDLSMMLGLYANDVLCRVAFGMDFSEGRDYQRHGFQKMLDDHHELMGGFNVGDFFPSLEFLNGLTGLKSRLQDNFRRFDKLLDQILNEHMSANKVEEHKDLVDVLLEVQKNGSDDMPLTTDNIKAVILSPSIPKSLDFRCRPFILSVPDFHHRPFIPNLTFASLFLHR
ncbi:hypothetical protein Fmac_000969 [Flemingia macrophylla]|uniref:Uncharacterized protein n=1 Tax=Flemingia macrophylla TaxID=520843 RepID=A0ABD1NFS5_9FABA